jgi:O-antigen/teichoic acid export membrane protein
MIKNLFVKYKLYISNLSFYFLPSVVSGIISVLINPILAKNLSYSDYAIIGYFNSFYILFLPMLNLSLISYYLRNYYLIQDSKRDRFSNTITISLLVVGLISSIVVLIGFYIFCKSTGVKFPFYPYAFFVVFQILFSNFLTLLQAKYRIKREAKKFALLSISRTIIWLILVVVLVVVLKLGAIGNLGANFFVAFLIGIYCLFKLKIKIEFDFSVFRDAMKFCWPLTLSAILWYFLSDVDRVFLEN